MSALASGGGGRAGGRHAPTWPGWAATGIAVVAVFLLIGILSDALAPAPSGPPSSSYATAPAGVAGWAELLARSGHRVIQLRRGLGQATLDSGSTLVVLGARSITPPAARDVDAFVRAGGRLVIDAASPGQVLPALISSPPSWIAGTPRVFHALAAVPETSGVRTVQTAGAGGWRAAGAWPQALGDRAGDGLLLVRSLGRGSVALLADPSPVQNRLLASADNAQLALNLAGPPGRPVIFAEALHGFGAATGLAALPGPFWLAFAGLCLAGGAWALGRGRRLGPPEPPAEAGPPPRSAYVDAMARALIGTADAGGLTRLTRARVGEEVDRRLARRARGTELPRRQALLALGLSEGEVEVALAPAAGGDGEDELIVLGRALARLRSER